MSKVGINLAAVNYWGSQYPFIDRMKAAGWWTAVASDRTSTTLTSVDANGYPTSLPQGTNYIYTSVALDPVELAMTDRYVITYTGKATIVPSGQKIISAEPGRIVFEATKAQIQLKVSGLDAADPLGHLSLVREDQVAAFAKGEIFNPDFVDKIDPFSTLRFMDWIKTNESTLSSWDDRPTMDDRSWAGSEGGVPVEVMVALANRTHNDMWVNIPAQADDAYVRNMLAYIRDNLDAGLKVKVEYSNEMWNFTFDQTKWAMTQGNLLWGRDANGDGVIDPKDAREHVGDGYLQYYGYRAAQVAAIANQVFGDQADARLETVLATNSTTAATAMIAGVAKAGLGSVAELFDDYATNAYFAALGSGTQADIDVLLGWARSGQAGIDAAIAEIAHGGTLAGTITVDDLAAKFRKASDFAASLGLDLVVYEGGADLTAYRAAAADQAELMAFYNRLLDDPRMGDLYRQAQAAFDAAGGVEFNAFNDAGSSTSKYGQWGALGNIYQKGSVRYDTLVALAEEGKASIVAAGSTRTTLASYTLSATQTDMTFAGKGHATIVGNALSNRLTAANGGSALYGGGGDDRLIGGTGADRLDGGTGADMMTGGVGNDVYVVDDAGDKVVEFAGGGTDEVQTSLSRYNLGSEVENLTYLGADGFRGTGNALANVIRGGAGDDVLNGGLGDDTLFGGDGDDLFGDVGGADLMVGGKGDDTYNVDHVGDRVVELADEGYDTVYTTVSYSIVGQAVEAIRAKGTAAIDFMGNELDNMLVGNDAANTIRGGAGVDSLKGMGGNDVLYGDTGDDVIDGGAGNDQLFGGGGNDRLVGGDGDDTVCGGVGTDVMSGGAGKDVFLFRWMTDFGTTRATADSILDFASGDKIDLSMLDAIKGTAADDAFTFIGAANFSGHAGELRVSSYGGRWDITGDIDGDGIADLFIVANKASAFTAADFVL